jgi:chemosensory pili system protein ChpA (sensor histidine kinase/response regulator)
MQSEQQQRIMGYFIEEAKDHLNTIEQGLLSLQSTIEDQEMVSEVFRAAHSVKGGAAMLGLTSIQRTAHRLEDYFKVLKECPVKVDQKLETLFLRVFDTLQELIDQLQGPFGLTDDKSNEIMAEVEPVFGSLNEHLTQLVTASGGTPPDEVDLVDQSPTTTTVSPAAAAPQSTQAGEEAFDHFFRTEVPTYLREMLQLFKQPDNADSRQQLHDFCESLLQAGDSFGLSGWCTLIETAQQAIAHEENSYKVLAPIVIKEIKQAQNLVLTNRVSEIACSDALVALAPEEQILPEAALDGDALSALLGDEPTDMGAGSSEAAFAFDMEPITDSTVIGEEELSLDLDGDAASDGLSFDDLGLSELSGGFDVDSSAGVDDFFGGLSMDEMDEPEESGDLGVLPEMGLDLIDEMDEDALDGMTPDSTGAMGPEVGIAELNTLADLFEGDAIELGVDWQEEEVIASDELMVPDLLAQNEPDPNFADLLTEVTLEADNPFPSADADDFSDLFSVGDENEESSAIANDLQLLGDSDELDLEGDQDFFDDLGLDGTDTTNTVATEETSLSDLDLGLDFDAELANEPPLEQPTFRNRSHSEEMNGEFQNLDELFTDYQEDAAVTFDLEEGLDDLDVDLSEFEVSQSEDTSGGTTDNLFSSDGNEAFAFSLDEATVDATDAIADVDSSSGLDDWLTDAVGDNEASDTEVDSSSGLDDDWLTDAVGDDESSNTEELASADLDLDGSDFSDLGMGEDLSDLFQLETLESSESIVEPISESSNLEAMDDFWSNAVVEPEQVLESVAADEAIAPGDDVGAELDSLFAFDMDALAVDASPEETPAATAPDLITDEALDNLFDFQSTEDSEDINLDGMTDLGDLNLDLDDLNFPESVEEDLQVTDSSASDTLSFDEDLAGLGLEFDEAMNSTEMDMFAQSSEDLLDQADTSTGDSLDFDDLNHLLDDSEPVASTEFDSLLDGVEPMEEAVESDFSSMSMEDLDFLLDEASDLSAETNVSDVLSLDTSLPEEDGFGDLDALLTDSEPDLGEGSEMLDVAIPEPQITNVVDDLDDEFADLDALLDEALPAAAIAPRQTDVPALDNEFADLEALLDDDAIAPTPPSSPPVAVEDEFDELEKLLEEADQSLGGSPPNKGSRRSTAPNAANRLANRRPSRVGDQTMRVSVKNLDNLNNLIGELVVNRNSLEQTQERLRQFLDNLLYQVQQLSDVGQRMRDLYERSLLESSLLSSRRGYQQFANAPEASSGGIHATGANFDALEMDRFTGFHTLSQEMIELIVRVRESASDIDFVVDESDQITRTFRQVTTQLQEGLTRARMVPFAQTADRLPRAVREISLKCGKQAELVVEGRDTLIDKMILEQLYDPMTHLVNNAITHGIETPEEREAAGKSPMGRITIRSFHQGNQTVISISDDGAGIDPERVKTKAIQTGLISLSESREMTRLDVYDLLFHPGFSTKDKADDFAGRGVGMDVVRTNLNEIRGTINTDSAVGKGTTFTIRLPLTLSISKALCCISNRARMAFPMDGVEDMLDVPRDRIQTDEEGRSCIMWREFLLPFQPLSELLRYNRSLGRGSVYGGNQEDEMISVVVLRSAGSFLALQVDQVLGEQEIVIKQLEGPVPKPIGIAGATVLGDGRIMPIADVLELIDLSMGRIRRDIGSSLWERESLQVQETPAHKTEPTVLIVDDSITVRELLSMTFSKVGYRVEQARDGQEAWEKLRSGLPCDLVFCDIEMPRMDGLELLSRIQKDPTLTHLPIAMLTSRGADRHRQMAITLGAKGYFTKPYLEEVLLDAAQRMIKGEVLVSSVTPS